MQTHSIRYFILSMYKIDLWSPGSFGCKNAQDSQEHSERKGTIESINL